MVQLVQIANARCGDKGNKVNIALFAKTPEHYALLEEYVTAEKVVTHFQGLINGNVTRYDVPSVYGLNFVLDEALAGGGSASLRVDNLGKCFASNLLRMTIEDN
ncbi:AtuA-related protein [Lysinibacillus sp. LZ02]|uniref:AtuA-related protein n=1 Tax=Lysinibacillus sp. LZ02 TaxID=3420668 RepID=UPI003D362E68